MWGGEREGRGEGDFYVYDPQMSLKNFVVTKKKLFSFFFLLLLFLKKGLRIVSSKCWSLESIFLSARLWILLMVSLM